MEANVEMIDRKETGYRILYSILFAVILEVLNAALGLIVLFELGYSLVTQQPPASRLREFANRLVAYVYRVQRYLTHNEPDLPFPFSDLPDPIEPSRWPYRERSGSDLSPAGLDADTGQGTRGHS